MEPKSEIKTQSKGNSMFKQFGNIISMTACASYLCFGQLAYAADNAVTLTWDTVLGATHYQVQEKIGDNWVTPPELVTTPLSVNEYLISGKEDGTYTFRVGACVEEPGVTIHCGKDVAVYTLGYPVTLEPSFVPVEVKLEYKYDALGRLVEVIDPTNGDRDYEYDDAGNRKSVTVAQ